MSRVERTVLHTLAALLIVLPLLRGGRHPLTLALGLPVACALLVLTLRARQRADAERTPGAAGRAAVDGIPGGGVLAAFATLALATTLPLPPVVLGWLAPATFRVYAESLPGWPDAGAWSAWRALALDPYGVWVELGRLGLGFAVYVVVVGYPWTASEPGEDAGDGVFGRLMLAALASGTLLSVLALAQEIAGDGNRLGLGETAASGRVSGPFVNPNHFAAWLEMVIPVTLAYSVALAARLQRRLRAAAAAGRSMGVRPRRAWVSALIANQGRLWTPLLAATALVLMTVTHAATGSRGGTAALLVGCAVAGAGMAAGTKRRGARAVSPWLAAGVGLALLITSTVVVVLWAGSDGDDAVSEVADVSLASRIAVAAEGLGIVRDHPLLGTGLGSWLHAFRPYQAPPVEGGIWDHAHNDYMELAAEGGVAALGLALAFALLVARAAREPAGDEEERTRRGHRRDRPPGFELPEWRAAFAERGYLRWGLAGSVAAILLHSVVEFALRMPANFTLLMMLAALLVVSARPRRDEGEMNARTVPALDGSEPMLLAGPAASPDAIPWLGSAPALGVLLAVLALVAVPQGANSLWTLVGAAPLAPRDCLERADLIGAEGGDGAAEQALALVRRAIDRSPTDREAHEALAVALGPGPDGDAALRRALALEPWSVTVRDQLALRLWARGERDAAARELEESMARFPYLISHAYLDPATVLDARDAGQLLRALADGDTLDLRLATLDPVMAQAIEHGLTRALAAAVAGPRHAGIVHDLVTVLEARGRWADAADTLRAAAAREVDGGAYLARAAHDYLEAHDDRAAEQALLAALLQRPEEGTLYHRLAVEVYAARGDFDSAQRVLKAGERNAIDMLPVYRAVTEVLTRRESARADEQVQPIALELPVRGAIEEGEE